MDEAADGGSSRQKRMPCDRNDKNDPCNMKKRGTPAAVLAAKAAAFRHAALGPEGAPPLPDARLLEWVVPETNRSEAHISLAYSTTKQVRHTSWQ